MHIIINIYRWSLRIVFTRKIGHTTRIKPIQVRGFYNYKIPRRQHCVYEKTAQDELEI
jgi:hypothetical protein